MGGVRFDDDQWVDPATPLLPSFVEWLATLSSARKSPGTVRGYASDAGLFATLLLDVLGREPREDVPDPAMTAAERRAVALLPQVSWARARSTIGVLALADLHPRDLAKAFDLYGSSGRSAAAHLRTMSAWSSLCDLLVRRGLLALNPMADPRIVRPKSTRPAPVYFDYDESQQLLRTLATPDVARTRRKPWPARDLALASILLTDGLRVSEAVGITLADLRAVNVAPRLHVLGKGSKWRTVPVNEHALATVQVYLQERTERLGAPAPGDKLFVHADGRPFTIRQLQHLVYRWYERAGIRPQGHSCVHALRHTFATQMLDSGATVEEVRAMLDHNSLETTRRYVHVVGSGLDDAVRTHPAGAAVLSALDDRDRAEAQRA